MKKQPLAIVFIMLSTSLPAAIAEDLKPIDITFLLKGSHCDDCADALKKAISKVEGIRFKADDIRPGEAPRYATEPFITKVAEEKPTRIGELAKAVSETKTPHKSTHPPSLSLVLYPIDLAEPSSFEGAISALRSELRFVSGVDVEKVGTLGGFPDRGFFWLQLEGDSAADLNTILEAAKRADVKVSLRKR